MSDMDTAASTPNLQPQEAEKPNPVREMRAALDAKNAELRAEREAKAALEAKLTEIERGKLDETERLRLEVSEMAPIRDEHGRFQSVLQKLYSEELATVPEEKREQVERLSAVGSWDARLEAIRAAKSLIPTQAQAAGSVTAPANRANAGGTTETPKLNPKAAASEYFGQHAKITTANISQKASELKNYQ